VSIWTNYLQSKTAELIFSPNKRRQMELAPASKFIFSPFFGPVAWDIPLTNQELIPKTAILLRNRI
jgi:hypothetical protein